MPRVLEPNVTVSRGAHASRDARCLRHSDLVSISSVSPYRKVCPYCEKGALMVQRNNSTGRLLRGDRCVWCGQPVRYIDDSINGEKFEGE